MSPMIDSGSRVLAAIISAKSWRHLPASMSRVGVMRMPSRNISLASTSKEPGVLPPTSDQCPLDCAKAMISSPTKTGRMIRTSLKWVPPA